jgi:hypothetical protein
MPFSARYGSQAVVQRLARERLLWSAKRTSIARWGTLLQVNSLVLSELQDDGWGDVKCMSAANVNIHR